MNFLNNSKVLPDTLGKGVLSLQQLTLMDVGPPDVQKKSVKVCNYSEVCRYSSRQARRMAKQALLHPYTEAKNQFAR